jgi:hypothetical protein
LAKNGVKTTRTGLSNKSVYFGYLLYYSYDSAGKSDMCDATPFNTSRGFKGTCFNGVIDPITGDLLPDVVAALMNRH